jgi:hypothetical protein
MHKTLITDRISIGLDFAADPTLKEEPIKLSSDLCDFEDFQNLFT